jgi:hypothetical protein
MMDNRQPGTGSTPPAALQCAEFEALLAEALDGTLEAALAERFAAHRALCGHCAPMFNEAQAGVHWLAALKEEVEPPARLVDNILRATSGAVQPVVVARKSLLERLREMPALAPVFHSVLQPRFAMSFGMAVFSISLLLNMAGVKLADLRRVDLRPSAVVRGYYETQGRVVKYYENMRFIYEVESRVRDLKRATTPETQNRPKPAGPKSKSLDPHEPGAANTPEPDKERYRNYSQDEGRPMLAQAWTATADRRWL